MTETVTRDWGDLAHPIRSDHPGDDKPPWKDNAYVSFWDPGNEVIGVVHVSTSPNAAGRRARASFDIGGTTAEIAEDLEPGTFASDSISFGLDGRIEVHGAGIDAAVDVVPRGAYCDYSVTDIIPALVEGEPLQHFQSAFTVTGSVAVGDASSAVDGVGLRDRTWGYRDESASWSEYIGVIIDLEGELLTIMKFLGTEGSSLSAGFMLGDEAVPTKELSAITRDASGLFAAATVTTGDGDDVEVRLAERTGGFWVPMGWERQGPTMSAYDEFMKVRTSDGREGYGMVEQGIIRRLG